MASSASSTTCWAADWLPSRFSYCSDKISSNNLISFWRAILPMLSAKIHAPCTQMCFLLLAIWDLCTTAKNSFANRKTSSILSRLAHLTRSHNTWSDTSFVKASPAMYGIKGISVETWTGFLALHFGISTVFLFQGHPCCNFCFQFELG